MLGIFIKLPDDESRPDSFTSWFGPVLQVYFTFAAWGIGILLDFFNCLRSGKQLTKTSSFIF